MEFSFSHNAWFRRRQGSRPGRWLFFRILAAVLGIWAPSVLLLWQSLGIILICVVEGVASVPQLGSNPRMRRREKGGTSSFMDTPNCRWPVPCGNSGVRVEVGMREGKDSCWGENSHYCWGELNQVTALDRMSETSYSVTFYKVGKFCHISTKWISS